MAGIEFMPAIQVMAQIEVMAIPCYMLYPLIFLPSCAFSSPSLPSHPPPALFLARATVGTSLYVSLSQLVS